MASESVIVKVGPRVPTSALLRANVRMGGSGEDSRDCKILKMQHKRNTSTSKQKPKGTIYFLLTLVHTDELNGIAVQLSDVLCNLHQSERHLFASRWQQILFNRK